jgi:hypothetical protein
MVNTEGYLIDKSENILDKYGRVVFRNDLLVVKNGQDAVIPPLFTSNILAKPETDQKPTTYTPLKRIVTPRLEKV